MRHSKSSWNEPNINDFQRPLSSKGRKDIKFIIKFLKNINVDDNQLLPSLIHDGLFYVLFEKK